MTFDVEQLESTFKKNIEFFKKHLPALAERFENYQPQAELVIDPVRGVNIYDRRKECFLYPGDGRLITSKQLAYWLNEPQFLTLSTQPIEGPDEWLHIRYINRLNRLREEILGTVRLSVGASRLPALLVVGVGLGDHLRFLTEHLEVENLLILEPNEDFFYISLHLLDWEEILRPKGEGKRRTVTILVGEDATDTDKITAFYNTIGPFKGTASFLYIHYLTEELKEFLKRLTTEVVSHISFFGFFDDEMISLRHTLENIKKGVPLFNPYGKGLKPDRPAVVVGSGPSLDFLLPYLKKYRDKLFVISCGTALGILEKNGIVPDLHVNIERNRPPYDAAVSSTSEDFRKKVPFLGANNNFPPFFEAFGRAAQYLKAGDAGAALFPQEKLYFVNPTVTNTGLAMAYYLGFERVYLFGVDLAFPDKKRHHATGSVYETLFKEDVEKLLKGELEVEGNFGGTLLTTSLFYNSKRVMEQSIDYFRSKRKRFEVFNPNRGAKIEGATPLGEEELVKHLEELETPEKPFEFWEKTVEPLREEWFDFPKVKMQLMTNFFQLKRVMEEEMDKLLLGEGDPLDILQEFYDYLRVIKEHNIILYHLLHGTINLYIASMYAGLLSDADRERKERYLKEAINLLKELLGEMERQIYDLYGYFPY